MKRSVDINSIMEENNHIPRAAIVGGGLVGALEACLLSQRGFEVTLFEARHDGRQEKGYFGRSINLAISHRGISALKRLNLEKIIAENAIPMKARMIHGLDGKLKSIQYDPDGRCINSIERASLNNYLLDHAESQPRVSLLFNHRLISLDADKGELGFEIFNENHNSEAGNVIKKYHSFDLIIGCDGAHSSVRNLLMKKAQIDFSQTFIEHGYMELRIDADDNGQYKMPPNFLHIWPRGQFMMIALPNNNKTFTCTLFMPNKQFSELKTPDDALQFFQKYFLDSIEFIGETRIQDTFKKTKPSPLVSVKCRPYHYKTNFLIMGDAAHAMVPFYGQGMNCGFEDCLVLDEIFDEYGLTSTSLNGVLAEKLSKCLQEFTKRRCDNGQAMSDLAMYNYVEMRDLVNSKLFTMRKSLDNILYRLMPTKWIPLYTMVTFSRIPINECVEKRRAQDKLLGNVAKVTIVSALFAAASIACIKLNSNH